MTRVTSSAVKWRTAGLVLIGCAIAVGVDYATDGVPKNGSVVQVTRSSEPAPGAATIISPDPARTAATDAPAPVPAYAAEEIGPDQADAIAAAAAALIMPRQADTMGASEVAPGALASVIPASVTQVPVDPALDMAPETPAIIGRPAPDAPCVSALRQTAETLEVRFASGSSSIALGGRDQILDLARRAADCPEAHITIVGIASPDAAATIAELPQIRAENVLALIGSNGFDTSRYTTRTQALTARGQTDKDAQESFRRVLFVLTGDGMAEGSG